MESVDRQGGKLIGIGLGQHDAMHGGHAVAQRGNCSLDVGKAGHLGHFIQGSVGLAEFGPRGVADEEDVEST